MVNDNHVELDYLLASQRDVRTLANTLCCFYINTTGQLEADVQTILKHVTWLWNFNPEGMKDTIWNTIKQAFPNLTWFLPWLDPLITLILICTFGPCIINNISFLPDTGNTSTNDDSTRLSAHTSKCTGPGTSTPPQSSHPRQRARDIGLTQLYVQLSRSSQKPD